MSENRESPRKGRGCGFGCVLMLALFAGLGVCVAVAVMGSLEAVSAAKGNGFGGLFHRSSAVCEMGQDDMPDMRETWSSGQGDTKVVRIPVEGMIMLGGSSWYAGNADTVLRAIRRATQDPEVKGLLLEINSGGGGITDSDIIYKALLDFKAKEKGRVVVSLMGDIAASGAYYIALASDRILVHPTTLTGSIGVIMQSYNFKELAARLGVQDVTIKSGANKDLFNPFHEIAPEQKELMQRMISAMHERFVGLVAENRKLPKETVAPLADGRIFLADEALKNGLIDGIGYGADAQSAVANLLEVEDVKVYRYGEHVTLMDILSGRPGIGVETGVKKALGEGMTGGRLMYKWSF
jgi:protease-4